MPDRSSFTLHTAVNGAGTLITITGPLDLTSAPALDRALDQLRQTTPPRLVLDMAGACMAPGQSGKQRSPRHCTMPVPTSSC